MFGGYELGIWGSDEHGKDVIKALELFRGNNANECSGEDANLIYYVDPDADYKIFKCLASSRDQFNNLFRIEEFKQLFPFEKDDNVLYKKTMDIYTVSSLILMQGKFHYMLHNDNNSVSVSDVTLLERHDGELDEPHTEEIALDINYDYDIIYKKNRPVLVKKQKILPSTYEECLEIIKKDTSYDNESLLPNIYGYSSTILENLRKLLICRNAYYIILNYQNDLMSEDTKYVITYLSDKIVIDNYKHYNYILSFPSEEIAIKFKENFNDIIEKCKLFI